MVVNYFCIDGWCDYSCVCCDLVNVCLGIGLGGGELVLVLNYFDVFDV